MITGAKDMYTNIIHPEEHHLSHSLLRNIRKKKFSVTLYLADEYLYLFTYMSFYFSCFLSIFFI